MPLPPGFLEEVRRRTSLTDLVARRVTLARRGNQATGLCPFHREKTPSFHVYESDGHYKCFGCGAYGDAISFLRETEGLEFREAVERLAEAAGLDVPRDRPRDAAAEARRLGIGEALAAACEAYRDALRGPGGAAARAYLDSRGVTPGDLSRFALGYAPGDGRWLKTRLCKDGFAEELLIEAGLLGAGVEGRSSYDYFRNRLLFPIADRRGRWIGFGGRVLDDSKPKYLNTPETELFKKGRTLFAHHLAREAARRQKVIVVEGYMDVVALHRAGFAGAVAPLGTALTEEQLVELWRMADEPLLAFDGDAAGRAAALKAADRALPLLEPGRALRVLLLPDGLDPDDLLRQNEGAHRFAALLDGARPIIDIIWEAELALRPVDGPERLADLRRRMFERADKIVDRALREDWRRDIQRRLRKLGGDDRPAPALRRRPRAIGAIAGRWRDPDPNYRPAGEQPVAELPSRVDPLGLAAVGLLRALLDHPALIGEFSEAIAAIQLADAGHEALRADLVAMADVAEALDAATLGAHLLASGHAGTLSVLARVSVSRGLPARADEADADAVRAVCAAYLEHLARPLAAAERRAALQVIEGASDAERWRWIRAVCPTTTEVTDDTGGSA